jgi:hypothetical protein
MVYQETHTFQMEYFPEPVLVEVAVAFMNKYETDCMSKLLLMIENGKLRTGYSIGDRRINQCVFDKKQSGVPHIPSESATISNNFHPQEKKKEEKLFTNKH